MPYVIFARQKAGISAQPDLKTEFSSTYAPTFCRFVLI